MMTQQFRVVISGRTISGVPLEDVKAEAGRVFRLAGAQLDQMFSGQSVVVSRSASQEASNKLLAKLTALDLEARIEPLAEVAPEPVVVPAPPVPAPDSDDLFALAGPPVAAPFSPVRQAAGGETPAVSPGAPVDPSAEIVCPKCGEGQPRRTLCRQCGLDMPRYIAAQTEAENDARAARQAEVASRQSAPGGIRSDGREWQASLFGLGFSGRIGCLDYFAATLISVLIWLLLTLLAAVTGKMPFAWLGLVLSAIYGFRCIALRLHDTDRTGWLSLVALVPFLGALMAIALLFIRGDDDENDFGNPPTDGGGVRLIVAIAAISLASGLTYRNLLKSPEFAIRFLVAASVGQGQGKAQAQAAESDEDEDEPAANVRYASNNRIDIYVMAGCTDCANMRAWLDANGLRYSVYAVDSDEQAAARLHSIIGNEGNIQLPVLEINGKVLPGNPNIGQVHQQLRQAPAS